MRLYRNNNAIISAATASNVTSSGMTVSGSVKWYKGDAQYGVAYKKHSSSTWTYTADDSSDVEVALTGLSASTKYDICIYCKWNSEYQRGAILEKTTEAAGE